MYGLPDGEPPVYLAGSDICQLCSSMKLDVWRGTNGAAKTLDRMQRLAQCSCVRSVLLLSHDKRHGLQRPVSIFTRLRPLFRVMDGTRCLHGATHCFPEIQRVPARRVDTQKQSNCYKQRPTSCPESTRFCLLSAGLQRYSKRSRNC